MQTMNGPVFSVRCRVCNYTVAYMSSLDYGFERAYCHLNRHKEEMEAKLGLVSSEQTC